MHLPQSSFCLREQRHPLNPHPISPPTTSVSTASSTIRMTTGISPHEERWPTSPGGRGNVVLSCRIPSFGALIVVISFATEAILRCEGPTMNDWQTRRTKIVMRCYGNGFHLLNNSPRISRRLNELKDGWLFPAFIEALSLYRSSPRWPIKWYDIIVIDHGHELIVLRPSPIEKSCNDRDWRDWMWLDWMSL